MVLLPLKFHYCRLYCSITNNFLSVYINYKTGNIPDPGPITSEALKSFIVFAAFAGAFLFIIIKSFEALTRKKAE